jgi:hypothetical protein
MGRKRREKGRGGGVERDELGHEKMEREERADRAY